ncbi:conserved hypothetical protein [Alteracholeplasma palmae J233]|uniref:Lipoprotein n=1 Tax=Alteracholeplasma palmae (strain ATCC 49389 / J233) TaxID=1318466 RepID=U4KKX2_ALTPJ|nr:hypothetical protein [Alteracholeplasma palmae]CCV64343.1 conserved hypothetical protein [Alteracholeplasma palmae J233]
MKKFMIFICLSIILVLFSTTQCASYEQFEDIQFEEDFKLLSDYTEEDYNDYYSKIDKRKFSGWKINTVNKNKSVSFISETLFSYYNDGKSIIDYHYKAKNKETRQYDISVSGSIGITIGKNDKTFKNGLTQSLKVDLKSKTTKEIQEDTEIKIKIEPKTRLTYYYYGEGKITNGVAVRYFFFIKRNMGGFEIFTVTTQYPKLEIRPI